MTRGRWGWALTLIAIVGARAHRAEAQRVSLTQGGSATVGIEGVSYRFGQNFGVRSLSQWAVPLAVVVSWRRFLFDAGTFRASTTFERRDRSQLTVTDFTDTQVRAAYVFGDDALVVTAVVNLPTGSSSLSASEYAVLAAASSSFLSFPVNAYGSGASFTGGAASAVPLGDWNLGLGASLRVSDRFTPFRDADGDFSYQGGVETRVRAAADRLIGSGRLTLGLSFSTFRDDEFSTGRGVAGVFRPGRRLIGEASYTTVIGASSVAWYAWDFLRTAGDSAGTSARNRENVLAVGLQASVPLRRTLLWEPRVEGRFSWPEEGNGELLELRSALRIRVTRRLSLVPALRLDLGRLVEPEPGVGHSIRGYGGSVFLRESF